MRRGSQKMFINLSEAQHSALVHET